MGKRGGGAPREQPVGRRGELLDTRGFVSSEISQPDLQR